MCGRFTLKTNAVALVEHFGGELGFDLPLRYNIAPTQPVATVRIDPGGATRRWQMVRWGLIPSWAKEASIGNRMINARAETVAEKPSFRTSWRCRRCLIPADGYYEWRKNGKNKQPFLIRLWNDSPFAMAGLWERWLSPETSETIESCTIITTEANELTRPIHDRMPVILNVSDYDRWLDPQLANLEPLRQLLCPFDPLAMRTDPVSTWVNSPRNDDSRCVAVVGP